MITGMRAVSHVTGAACRSAPGPEADPAYALPHVRSLDDPVGDTRSDRRGTLGLLELIAYSL